MVWLEASARENDQIRLRFAVGEEEEKAMVVVETRMLAVGKKLAISCL